MLPGEAACQASAVGKQWLNPSRGSGIWLRCGNACRIAASDITNQVPLNEPWWLAY